MEKNNIKIGIAMVVCLIVGAMMGRVSPISNSSKNDNSSKVYITQKIPQNSEKFEKKSKNSEIFDINNDDLEYIKNSLSGIGDSNIRRWRKRLDEKGKFDNVYQLLEDGVLGRDSFSRHKDRFYVGE